MTKILIVDDSALMRRVLGTILGAEADMEIAYARNGVEALERVHDWSPDVITLDIQMPGMDGLTCLDRIMLERPSRVVIVSSLTVEGADIALEAMELGAVDAIAKPAGAISLALDVFGPMLVETLRAAAAARLSGTARLAERVRRRAQGAVNRPPSKARRAAPPAATRRLSFAGQAVVIGTSTGGPPALEAVLGGLPGDFPWPILVAQHMPATFTGSLARRLDKLCALHVMEVTAPVPIAPGTVYVAQGEADMIMGARPGGPVVMAAPADPAQRWHPSVDRLVRSAMLHMPPERLVGVLLTGMGNDGAAAMTELCRRGGRTIAESEATAIIWGMPGELARAGGADHVLALGEIAGQLLGWAA
jgi:two-component system chemotaxis response regulator CheB